MVMDKRKAWLKKSLYVAGGEFIISSLTGIVLGAAVQGCIVLSPLAWAGVRVLVIIAAICLLTGLALVVRVLTLKGEK